MNDINELYQEVILDHSRAPKNFGSLDCKSHQAHGNNPLCGDVISLELLLKENVIEDVAFKGDGCAISKASASLMTESIKGKSADEVKEIFDSFHSMLTEQEEHEQDLGKLLALKGVKQFPIRVKCATLCWHTLNAALNQNDQMVTTE